MQAALRLKNLSLTAWDPTNLPKNLSLTARISCVLNARLQLYNTITRKESHSDPSTRHTQLLCPHNTKFDSKRG